MFVIYGIVVLLLVLFLEQFLNGGEREGGVTFSEVDGYGWRNAIVGALGTGVAAYFAPRLFDHSIWLVVILAGLIAMLVYICTEWHGNVYPDMVETVLAILLTVIVGGFAIYTSTRINRGLVFDAFAMWAAIAATVFTIAYIIVMYLARNHELKWLLPAFAMFAVAALLFTSIGTGVVSASMVKRDEGVAEELAVIEAEAADDAGEEYEVADGAPTEDVVISDDVHFYNDDVQGGEVEDDFDFGPNPWKEGEDVYYYVSDFEARRAKDPALLAATMVALDGTLGTDFIGEVLYEGYDERLNMLERADAAARVLAADPELFARSNEAVNKLFASASKVELKKLTGLEDQLYMYNATISGIPGIVSYVSDFDEGWCLVWTFQIKDGSNTTQEIAFHIPCGYQWTNGAEKINVVPEKKPDKVTQPGKDPTPTPTPEPEPEPEPDPKPKYKKDPSKAPNKNTEPNDDKGPGPDTNNDKDPQHSTKDTADSTTSQTHDETKKNQQDKADTNKNQKTGNDSSQPSTDKPKQDTKVDNNGDKINKPTKTNTSGSAAGQDNDGTITVPD